MTGRKAKMDQLLVTQFELNDEHIIMSCPTGHQPIRASFDAKKQVYKATFTKDGCNFCPLLANCPILQQKKNNTVRFTSKKLQMDTTRSKQGTERHRELYCFRTGVEGVVSAIR
jgi:hypothetical protein